MSIGLPTLEISFKKAAETVSNRIKQGICGVIVRDASASAVAVTSLRRTADIPTALAVDNVNYISLAFTGSTQGAPSKVILATLPAEGEIANALDALEYYSIDYLAAPPDCTTEDATAIQEWVTAQRAKYRTVKAVLPNTAADSMGIINFATSTITTAKGTFTTAKYCNRIAGILAGTPIQSSATYAALSEVSTVPTLTDEERTAAIAAGKLILIHDGTKVKVDRAVNSMTTIPTDGTENWKKIKIVEAMDLITYYARTTIEDEYVGKCANTYDNKCLLVSAFTSFFTTLETAGVLNAGETTVEIDVDAQRDWLTEQGTDTTNMTDTKVLKANTGSWVFLKCSVSILDAMEDFKVAINTAS